MELLKEAQNGWEEYEHYWISKNPQGTDEWLKDRVGRITMSKLGAVVGHSNFPRELNKQERIDRAASTIAGVFKEEFDQRSIDNMSHGTNTEPLARDWYSETYNCKVEEYGLVVPKWNKFFGASVDGCTKDGIIEIKCPKRMYRLLTEHTESVNRGTKYPDNYYDHIFKSHLDQMMGGMAVLNKKYCDYIVFCTPENAVFTQRIYFDPKYWVNELYKPACKFIEYKLKPLLINEPKLPTGYILENPPNWI